MTPKQAAARYREIRAEQDKLTPELKECSKVLLRHFADTNTTELDGVCLAVDERHQLDTNKVRTFLGDKIEKFLKAVTRRTLFVRKEPAK